MCKIAGRVAIDQCDKKWKLSRSRKSVAFVAIMYNIWEAVVSSGSLLYGPHFAFMLWACRIFGDRPLLERLKLLHSLLRSQTASKLSTAVHQDQAELSMMWYKLQVSQKSYLHFICHHHTLATQHVRGKRF